ncbi:MAG: tRNA (N6-threonylcarbamoyladenosine(37)-N6)-methyltransferase TrmO [Deltaproteobacteria bacterium]|nr:MAG: tRNA (N6-threonylcarbamoyladenosine(37)-N6)-methyltransferase TrmO [Deltaproteobacteria bacterium]
MEDKKFYVYPVGVIKRDGNETFIEIYPEYKDALLNLEYYSHIIVLFWFDKNDTQENRKILQVHPKRHKGAPLSGVFATCSPVRPNLIGLTICKIEQIEGNIIKINEIDAFDNTPVLDIKPYIPKKHIISKEEIKVPQWMK